MPERGGREYERLSVTLRGVLRLGEHPDAPSVECQIQDLSVGGTKIKVSGLIEPSALVTIKIGQFGEYAAKLAWMNHPFFGLKFRHNPEVMAELCGFRLMSPVVPI